MKQRYNPARALLHSEDKSCPEAELHYQIRREEEKSLAGLNLGSGLNRQWKSGIRAPFGSLLTRDLAVNPSTNAALTVSTVIPEIQASLRPSSLLMKLPIQIVEASGVFILPRLSTGTAASPLSEIQLLSSSDPAFGATGGGPSRLSVQVSFSKQSLAQAAGSESLDNVLKRDLARAISQKMDNELINGSGVAGDVTGILNQISQFTSFTFGAAASWSKFSGAQKSIESNFIDADSACYLIGPATADKLRSALKGTSTAKFIMEDDSIGNIDCYVSVFAGVTEQVILADWSQVVVGIWGGGFDFVTDPYTKAASGEVVITCALLYNIYVRRPQAVILSTDSGAQ